MYSGRGGFFVGSHFFLQKNFRKNLQVPELETETGPPENLEKMKSSRELESGLRIALRRILPV